MSIESRRASLHVVRILLLLVAIAATVVAAWWLRPGGGGSPELPDLAVGAAPPPLEEPEVRVATDVTRTPAGAREDVAREHAGSPSAGIPVEGRRRVSGTVERADRGWLIHCRFEAHDASGAPVELEQGPMILGRFQLLVAAEAARLVVTPSRNYHLGAAEAALPGRGDVEDLRLVLPKAHGVVKGRVVDEAGLGVEGIDVRLAGDYARRTTDENGAFRFGPLRDGSYAVALANVAFSLGDAEDHRVHLVEGRQSEPLLISVRRGATLRGLVRPRGGEDGVAGALAVLTQDGASSSHRSARADAEGRFAFPRLVGGRYRLAVTDESGSLGRAVLPVEVGAEEDLELVVELSANAGSIEGRLVDEAGDPLPFATVVARRIAEDDASTRAASPGPPVTATDGPPAPGAAAEELQARTDTSGRFRFPSVGVGAWTVGASSAYCHSRNWIPDRGARVEVVPDTTTTVTVELERGSYLEGKVRSESKRRELVARLRCSDGRRFEQSLGGDGHFAFGGLRADLYTLEIVDLSLPGDTALAQQQVYVSGGADTSLELRVP